MTKLIPLVLVHLWLAAFLYFCIGTIRGQFAEKTYDARMKYPIAKFLMPGRLRERETWVRRQRVLAWLILPIAVAIYIVILVSVLRGL